MAMAPMVLSWTSSSAAGTPLLGDTVPLMTRGHGTHGAIAQLQQHTGTPRPGDVVPLRTHGRGTHKAIMHQRAEPWGHLILGT